MYELNFNSINQLLSTIIGYAILVLGSTIKLLQLYKLIRNKSTKGVSILMFQMEYFCCIIGSSWGLIHNLSLSVYGETIFMGIQLLCIITVACYYTLYPGKPKCTVRQQVGVFAHMTVAFTMLGLFVCIVFTELIPYHVVQLILKCSTGVIILAKVPQIVKIYTTHYVGNLSIVMFSVASLGNMARFYTTLMHIGINDGRNILLMQYFCVATSNFIIMLQILYLKINNTKIIH